MKKLNNYAIILLFLISSCSHSKRMLDTSASTPPPRILVFTKTLGYHHASIPAGIAALQKLSIVGGFVVDTTTDAINFNSENLQKYKAVVFCNTTGDVLNDEQQKSFEKYIQSGGGYLGIHSATDTEYDWPWYGQLAGAYFVSHPNNPNVRRATISTDDNSLSSIKDLPKQWSAVDEWYNYRQLHPSLKIIARIDEASYEGGTNGSDHPIVWYHNFNGGRAFYIGLGHTDESYSDPKFLVMLKAGLEYVIGISNKER